MDRESTVRIVGSVESFGTTVDVQAQDFVEREGDTERDITWITVTSGIGAQVRIGVAKDGLMAVFTPSMEEEAPFSKMEQSIAGIAVDSAGRTRVIACGDLIRAVVRGIVPVA